MATKSIFLKVLNHILLSAAIVLFLLINSNIFWIDVYEANSFSIFTIGAFAYFLFIGVLIFKVCGLFIDHFGNVFEIYSTLLLATILMLLYYFLFGIFYSINSETEYEH